MYHSFIITNISEILKRISLLAAFPRLESGERDREMSIEERGGSRQRRLDWSALRAPRISECEVVVLL